MTRNIPPMPWLRAFEASARHLNFSIAADELGLTPAAVSYQVRALEDELGYRLFLRKKRPMELTTMGALYLPWVTRAFALLGQGTSDVFGPRMVRPVRIRCLQSLVHLWLGPRLPDFRARHPDVVLQLHMASWASTLDRDQLDLDIRYGDGRWPDRDVHLLCRDPIFPVCHPDLARPGLTVDGLAAAPLIEIIGVADTWRQFFVQEGVAPPDTGPGLQADQSLAALEFAALGMGHALVLKLFADPYLRDGRLVRSLPVDKRSEQGLYLLSARDGLAPEAALFRDWLINAFA
ncbi:MAG: LysR substrate-binding domain-containing protein [Marinibacterium sp.]|nr:LysR substrate-binding domain-containing protein [Marinibacterium sp.]